MRRESIMTIRLAVFGLAVIASDVPGREVRPSGPRFPSPRVPEVEERSGLLQRFNIYNFKTNLPQDPYRDNFYGYRYGNYGKVFETNTFWDGGLYGVRLAGRDTASVYPYFYGTPGKSTITPESKSWRPSCLRALQQLTHQKKPVGMYYDRGSYVPIYDLDSFSARPRPGLLALVLPGKPRRLSLAGNSGIGDANHGLLSPRSVGPSTGDRTAVRFARTLG